MLPFTSSFFSTIKFPFSYNRRSYARQFMHFLKQVLPDRDTRLFIQEELGYLLTHDTKHAKLVILYGTGANGKSVLLNIFKLIIGKDNYSSLPFDAFYGDNRFLLIRTEGKTANIYEEIPEDRKIKTATIKNLVTGGEFTVEEKFQESRTIKATAKLVFATNTLPNFSDKSDGIFRRLAIIPFNKQFLNANEQNPNLITDEYWLESGELEGIFNWAVQGLARLLKRGHFVEPQCSLEVKKQFRLEQNPEKQFLIDHYQFTGVPRDCVSSFDLYQKYKNYTLNYGYRPCSSINLGKEVRRTFPQISQSRNPVHRINGIKSRLWFGLKLISEQLEQ